MSSYIIEYIIDFLVSNHAIAKTLRENFVFKIIPMLNIDGVIIGNYRCNLSGADLNRQYIDPSKKLHPTIYFAKNVFFFWYSSSKRPRNNENWDFVVISTVITEKRIFLFVKIQSYLDGCAGRDNSKKEQVFSILMKNNCPVFSFKDCCFAVQKDR